jgi:hypothetical protein
MAFSHMGHSFPGGVKANTWQQVLPPGGFSFGLGLEPKFNRLLPFEEWEKVAVRPDEGSFFA